MQHFQILKWVWRILIFSMRPVKAVKVIFIFLIISLCFTVILICRQINEHLMKIDNDVSNSIHLQRTLDNVEESYYSIHRKLKNPSKDIKSILLWTPYEYSPFYYLGEGQENFIKNKCPVIDCYVTSNRNYFEGDVSKFDAIAFNGRNLLSIHNYDLPKNRSTHQKYIYFNMESADNYPICHERFDNYFNWTATYKLDSDIPLTYLSIRNMANDRVGPNINMTWESNLSVPDELLNDTMSNKSKAVAWFVSNCKTKSRREIYAKQLQKALSLFGHDLHVFGKCGPMTCSRDNSTCDKLLETEYFFYLSFENSFQEDYVTEKLLTALQHNVIPIVYGGANYSRFLPPGSYLDATKHTPLELASRIDIIISSLELYREYFGWKSYYTYHDPKDNENICALCSALNNITMLKSHSTYKEFRSWWHPRHQKRCQNWFLRMINSN